MTRRAVSAWLGAFVLLSAGCGTGRAAGGEEARWREAQRMWERRDVRAWEAWKAIDPRTPEGREAQGRLELADAHYREGVARIEAGRDDAREELSLGVAIAPMDPRLYLPLARACHQRGFDLRAVEYYLKFLGAVPDGADADAARRELRELEPELADVFSPPPSRAGEVHDDEPTVRLVSPVTLFGSVALIAAIGLVVWARRRRGLPLGRLVREHPELHPAIAYLVGSLRHELLKHRIGAVGEAVRALAAGSAGKEQLAFLRSRLYGGEPLREAWRAHLRSFDRALGFRLDVRRDPWLRSAGRAISVIASLEDRFDRPGRPRRRLESAHERLRALDAHLARVVRELVRTRVDAELLTGVVDEVRAEYEAGRVALDALIVEEPEETIEVEVFRIDLSLILKNVIRNAILAAGRSAAPRRVAIGVRVDLEPTGEEIVRIRVRDTSAEAPSPEAIRGRAVDRGLGLVTAALSRYDGSIDVEDGGDGYAKSVTLRFFRALPDDDDQAREAA